MKSTVVPIGTATPEFVVDDGTDEPRRLSDLRGRVILLVFFRGHWCQSCRRQLALLESAYETIQALNAELIAISADSTGRSAHYHFPLVADQETRIIERFGIRDDDDHEGRRMARPATFILDQAGVVRFCHVGTHRQDRPSLGAILLAIESLASPRP